MNKTRLVGVVRTWAAVAIVGCSPSPGAPADAADVQDVADAPAAPGDVTGDAAAAGLDGDWRVTAWTAARAIGGDFPGPEDGGTANPVCADDARARYSPMEVSIRGGAVRVNGADCEATVSGAAVTARCNCGGAFIVCGSALTMRLEGATLRGTQRLDFNRMAGPAYCAVEATFEASRR